MSHNLTLAQNHAFDLARTLMVPVILFQAETNSASWSPASTTAIRTPSFMNTTPGPRLIEPGDRLPLAPCRLQGKLRRARDAATDGCQRALAFGRLRGRSRMFREARNK